MFILALYGAWVVLVSAAMMLRPGWCAEVAVRYIRSRFMHPIEILIMIGPGLAFVYWGRETRFPGILVPFGWLLVMVGVGLMLTPPSMHRRFGIWSVRKFERAFRPAGAFSLAFGAFLIYGSL